MIQSVQADRDECISFISDLTKEIYGFRPRYEWASIPLETLAVMVEEVIAAHEYSMEDQQDWNMEIERFENAADLEREDWASVCPDEFDELCEIRGW